MVQYGAWLSWGSILMILLLSAMAFFGLIAYETLGILEALLLCGVWLGASVGKPAKSSYYKVAAPLIALMVIIVTWSVHPLLFIYVPPIGINLLLAVFFFYSLRAGSEPAITRIARVERESFDDRLYAYTRGVTWAWALLFSALIIEALFLIAFAPINITLLFLNFGNYVIIALFFVAENIYRRIHLRNYTHMPIMLLVARLSSRGIMSLIRYQYRR